MSRRTGIVFVAALSFVGHLLLGWWAVVPAAVLGALFSPGKGWLTGLAGVCLAWTGVVAYSFGVAPGPTGEMARSLGQLAGGLPAPAIPVATLMVGALLGAVSGWLGHSLRNIVR
ncbi:MAG: hypothetical protein ACI9W4_001598 [Rhodothermales bacterium]|jgi:hypothetical protein